MRQRGPSNGVALLAAAMVLASLGSTAGAGSRASLLIRHARLVDASGVPARTNASILIRDGRIVEIGSEIRGEDVPVLDVGGATVVPGLIDAHVHLMSVPGSDIRQDSPARLRSLRRKQLRSYLACGVTTVLDAGTDVATAREVAAWLAAGHPGPTVLTLGPPIAARRGYMSGGPGVGVAAVEDIDAVFDAIEGVGAAGVKVPLERGFGPDNVFPIHAPGVREAIAREAAERRLPIYVHASDEIEQTLGLEMGAHALMHTNFGGGEPSPEFIARAAHTDVYMVTTFSIVDAGLVRWHPERLDAALVALAVPANERRTARSADAWLARDRSELAYAFPRFPGGVVRFLAWLSPPREQAEVDALAANLRAAQRLHAAGVALVVGSDAGNTSLLSQFHGTSTLRELELLAEAGLSAAEVLAAATRVPARMLGIETDVGVLEPGKRGDLVVLGADPLADARAFRTIRGTIKDGTARTPEEWMTALTRAGGTPRRGARALQ